MLDHHQFNLLIQLSPLQRQAFVAGCAERVYDAYTYTSHPPSSKFAQGLELLWASIDSLPEHVRELGEIEAFFVTEVSKVEIAAGEETLQSAAMGCLVAAIRTVISSDANEAIVSSQYLSGTAARSNRQSLEAIIEEDRWQSKWLLWCQENSPRLARAAFNEGNERPTWVDRMESGGLLSN